MPIIDFQMMREMLRTMPLRLGEHSKALQKRLYLGGYTRICVLRSLGKLSSETQDRPAAYHPLTITLS
jgi:hypothetical protein